MVLGLGRTIPSFLNPVAVQTPRVGFSFSASNRRPKKVMLGVDLDQISRDGLDLVLMILTAVICGVLLGYSTKR